MDSTCRGNFTDYCASLRGGGRQYRTHMELRVLRKIYCFITTMSVGQDFILLLFFFLRKVKEAEIPSAVTCGMYSFQVEIRREFK